MELLRRILSAVGLDCMRGAPASPQRLRGGAEVRDEEETQIRISASSRSSPTKRSWSHAGSMESNSSSTRTSQGAEPPHCQSCISYDGHMKRLSCGHMFCNSCTDRIVNQAFLDIEGLCNFPCPMCKSLRELGLLDGGERQSTAPGDTPHSVLQLEVIKEEEEVAGD